MKREKVPCCGVSRFLTLLDGPWATLIVRELLHGPQRFTQLREALPGISAHTLTHRLKGFERHGLVTRTAFAETPPRVVYELTPMGEGLRDVLEAMRRWGDALPPEVLGVSKSDTSDEALGAALGTAMGSCPFSAPTDRSHRAPEVTGQRSA
jgi:DNA-binding HxlR family transcriptional regulator